MSERQARIKRKNEPQQEVKKKKGSIAGNVIITIIVIAFLGLGLYAIKDKLPKPAPKPTTVSKLAKGMDMSVEDFLKEYGLDGDETVTKDTLQEDFESKLTVANYAKYIGKTVAELASENGLAEDIDENALWTEAQAEYEMISHFLQKQNEELEEGEEPATFEDYLKGIGVPEDLWQFITEDKSRKFAEDFISGLTVAKYAEYTGKTVAEILKDNGIKENLPEDTLWKEAQQYETMGHFVQRLNAESGENTSFKDFMAESGIPEDLLPLITEDTTYKDAIEMIQSYEAAGSEQEQTEAEGEPEAETETETDGE